MGRKLSLGEYIRQLNKNHIDQRKRVAFTSVLALFVMFVVVWVLRVKGISMANETDCGIEEHIHIEECYQLYLVCGLNEGETEYIEAEDTEAVDGTITIETLHGHSDKCYEKELICDIPEHRHTVECVNLEESEEQSDDYDNENQDVTTSSGMGDLQLDDEVLTTSSGAETEVDELEEIAEADDNDIEEAEEIEDSDEIIIKKDALNANGNKPNNDEINAMITKAYEDHLEEMKKPEELRDPTKIIQFGEFYVVTAAGVRHKDMIHEYLDAANGNISSTYRNDITYTDEDGKVNDYHYIRNAGSSSNHDAASNSYRYLTYEGLPLQLVVFRTPDLKDNYIHTVTSDNEDGTIRAGTRREINLGNSYTALVADTVLGAGDTYGTSVFRPSFLS